MRPLLLLRLLCASAAFLAAAFLGLSIGISFCLGVGRLLGFCFRCGLCFGCRCFLGSFGLGCLFGGLLFSLFLAAFSLAAFFFLSAPWRRPLPSTALRLRSLPWLPPPRPLSRSLGLLCAASAFASCCRSFAQPAWRPSAFALAAFSLANLVGTGSACFSAGFFDRLFLRLRRASAFSTGFGFSAGFGGVVQVQSHCRRYSSRSDRLRLLGRHRRGLSPPSPPSYRLAGSASVLRSARYQPATIRTPASSFLAEDSDTSPSIRTTMCKITDVAIGPFIDVQPPCSGRLTSPIFLNPAEEIRAMTFIRAIVGQSLSPRTKMRSS